MVEQNNNYQQTDVKLRSEAHI